MNAEQAPATGQVEHIYKVILFYHSRDDGVGDVGSTAVSNTQRTAGEMSTPAVPSQ